MADSVPKWARIIISEIEETNVLLRSLIAFTATTSGLSREAIILTLYNSGLTTKEIAQLLRLQASTVAKILTRGLDFGSKARK